MDNHIRLREERERLGLSQTELGEAGGVRKQAQHLYETGARQPDMAYLSAIAAAGADVLYILTGQRSKAVAEVDLLPADERALVDAYRRCNADARRNLIKTAALLSAGMGVSPPAARHKTDMRGMTMNNNTPGAVQVGYAAGKVSIKRR